MMGLTSMRAVSVTTGMLLALAVSLTPGPLHATPPATSRPALTPKQIALQKQNKFVIEQATKEFAGLDETASKGSAATLMITMLTKADQPQAAEQYLKYLDKNLNQLGPRVELVRAYLKLGDLESADKHLLLDPRAATPEVNLDLVHVYLRQGKREQALKCLDQVLAAQAKVDPKKPETDVPLERLAYALVALGKLDLAQTWIDKQANESNRDRARVSVMVSLGQQKNPAEARKLCAQLNPPELRDMVYAMLAYTQAVLADVPETKSCLSQIKAEALRAGISAACANILAESGTPLVAKTACRDAALQLVKINDPWDKFGGLRELIQANLRLGDTAQAKSLITEAQLLIPKISEPGRQEFCEQQLSRQMGRMGDVTGALKLLAKHTPGIMVQYAYDYLLEAVAESGDMLAFQTLLTARAEDKKDVLGSSLLTKTALAKALIQMNLFKEATAYLPTLDAMPEARMVWYATFIQTPRKIDEGSVH